MHATASHRHQALQPLRASVALELVVARRLERDPELLVDGLAQPSVTAHHLSEGNARLERLDQRERESVRRPRLAGHDRLKLRPPRQRLDQHREAGGANAVALHAARASRPNIAALALDKI